MSTPSNPPAPVIKGSPLLKGFRAHLRTPVTALLLACFSLWTVQSGKAATVYWDVNGTGGAGATNTGSATGTWDGLNTFFNTDPTGLAGGALAAWGSGDTLVFGAGTNATQAYAVTASGTQQIGGLTFEEGLVTLTGGTLQMTANSDFNVASGLTSTINSTIDGAFDLSKLGAGTLVLGGANTYSGRTLINAGTLSISADNNLGAVPGAVTADSINFTGSSTLQFTGTGNPTINSNRGITINSGVTGTAQVVAPANTVAYGGVITGIAGTTFRKTGAGTLNLSGNSTSAFLGALNVDGGTLTLSGAGELAGTSGVTIGNRGALTLDNTATNLGNRIAGGITTTTGGTLNFTHAGAAATNYAENVGLLTLTAGALTINGSQAASGQTSAVTLSQITRSAGGTLYFNGTGAGTDNRNQLLVTSLTGIPASGVIIPWAVVNDGTGVSFAQNTGAGTTLRRFAGAVLTTAPSNWVAASNARPAATGGINNANRSVNTITFDNGVNLDGTAATALSADRNITMSGAGGGAILQTGGTSSVTSNGSNSHVFVFGGNEALFHILGTLDIGTGATADTNLTGTGGLTKTGAGTLIVRGLSSITGTSRINEGIMEGRNAASFGATSAMQLNGGTMRLSNDTGTTFTSNITVNADSTIQVDRVTAAATATTHQVGTLTIGGGRVLSVNSNDITSGTAYGLTAGALTLTSGGATIDVANNGAGIGTMIVTSVAGAFPLIKTGAGDFLNNSVAGGYTAPVEIQAGRLGWGGSTGTVTESQTFSGAGGLIKSGVVVVNLTGANTFTGEVRVTNGTLGFSTVSDNGGTASNLGQGTDGISMGGGTLSFIGGTSQSTNRAVSFTAASTLSANGTGGASITYATAVNAGANNWTLGGTAGSAGFLTNGIASTGATDATINGGTWTLNGTSTLGDDLTVTGANTILNLNNVNALTFNAAASADATLQIQAGATVNIGATDAVTAADFDRLLVGQGGAAATSVLNMGAFNLTTARFDVGGTAPGLIGNVNGSGTLTVTADFNFLNGVINANLATAAANIDKNASLDTVTLRGDNSGLVGGGTFILAGGLTLDYTASNTTKVNAAGALDMRGGTLTMTGNAAATAQTVASLTLASGGANRIDVNAGAGGAVLNLNAITRAALANDGTMRFELPTGTQSATNGITTDALNNNATTNGILGGWATVDTGTGVFFARNDTNALDGNIVAATTTTQDALGSWTAGINVTDSAGYSGTLADCMSINSLRFDANAASAVTIPVGGILNIASGGVLMTSNASTGAHTISGGVLTSGIGELIFTQDSVAQGLTVSSSITAASGITKTGNGTLTLSGSNNYTGITDLQAGTLVAAGTGIGDRSAVTLSAVRASTLQITGNETIGVLAGGNLVSAIGVSLGVVDLGSNTLTINQSGSSNYSGTFTGNGTIVLNTGNTGNLNLNNVSTGFSGAVVVNGGLFQIGGAGRIDATSFTVNKGGNLLVDANDVAGVTEIATRILDTTPITLNSADGAFSGQTIVRGLATRVNQNGTFTETVGTLTFGSGASYLSGDASGTTGVAAIQAENIVRSNNATVSVRGRALGTSSGDRNLFRINSTGFAANDTAFLATRVGGGGAAGTQNISIVPWGIGETIAVAALTDLNMGNSLVTYGTSIGFRPLDFATEYDTLSLAAATDNARESLTANLTGIAGKTVNSLVLHNADTTASTRSVTGSGAAQTLTVTSGALLFTRDTAGAGAYALTLGGFDGGIQVGSTNEYVIHVVNPDSASATKTLTASITSPLNTAAASLTKSGRGTLVLSELNTYGAGTTINEGVLQAGDLDHLGTGGMTFAGGTFQFGSAWNVGTDDLSTRTLTFLSGGATLDTNGKNAVFANGIGNSGAGGFTKAGTGSLTLNGAATYTGRTSITGGSIVMGVNQAVGTGDLSIAAGSFLNLNGFNASVGSVTTADSATAPLQGTGTLTASGDVILNRGAVSATLAGSMNLLKQTTAQTVTLSGMNSYTGLTHVQLGTLSINTIDNAGSNSAIGAATGENAVIRLGSTTNTGTLLYTGAAASSDRSFVLLGSTGGAVLDNDGAGALTLSGSVKAGTAGSKPLTLQGTAGTVSLPNVLSGMICEGPAVVNLIKAEAGVWELSGANEYSGGTSINAGTLIAGHDSAFGSGLVTLNGGNLNDDGTLRTLANALTVSNATSIIGGSGGLTFTGALTSAVGLKKAGAGTMTLSGTTASYTGTTEVRDGALVLAGGVNDRLGTNSSVVLGDSATSGILQLGSGAGASNQTLASLATSGTGTTNAIVGGSGSVSTLTVNQTTNTTFAGNIGGTGTNQNNLNVVKQGAGELIVSGSGAGAWTGTTTVNGGKLLIDSTSAFNAATTSLTVADGAEFSLRGTGLLANQVYGFGASAGNKITVGSGAGTALLGFRIDGGFNTQLQLLTGQTMTVTTGSIFQTAVYVDDAPTNLQQYILIDGADANSLDSGGGTFDFNPVVFNGGSFTYALTNETGGGTYDRWVLTPTAQAAAADVWWKGDLTGIGAGVWSASTTSGIGFPTNWDDGQNTGTDALVPPDSGSIVHFSATGAANFATTLGANLTIQELIFHSGATDISVGGANTLTIGNTVDAAGITLQAGAPTNVSFSANVALAQAQSFNIADSGDILTFTGGLSGTGALGINDNGSSTGTMVLGGASGLATYTGATNLVAGRLILQGGATNRLPTTTALTLGNATLGAALQLGDSVNGASNTTIGTLNTGAATTNSIVGGFTTPSILTVVQGSAGTFNGIIGGAGTNENQVGITKQGTATLILDGANTYTGATTVNNGILRLGTTGSLSGTTSLTINANAGVTAALDINGRTAVLGGAITLGGADSSAKADILDTATGGLLTLGGVITYDATNNPLASVIDVNLTSTAGRTITVNDSSTVASSAAELTFNGTIAMTGGLTFAGAGNGVLNGAQTQAGTNISNTFNSTGTWWINAATATSGTGDWAINSGVINATVTNALNAADDIIIDGTGVQDSAIVNISGTAGTSGVHQGDGIFIRNGGRINVTVNNGISLGTNTLNIGDSASTGASGAGRLDLAANISTTGALQLGAAGNQIGNITGTGTITSASYSLRGGSIGSNVTLAGTGGITKVSDGTVTFSGDRTTSGATAIQEGNLILDYTTNTNSKIGGVLTLGAATANLTAPTALTMNANAAVTTQSVTSTTISNSGDVFVDINDAGAATTLALGAITRSVVGGTVSFDYSSASAVATTSNAAAGALGWATVTTGGTTRIGAISGGNIVQATTTTNNTVNTWGTLQNVINTAGYSGTLDPNCNTIASLTFDAAAASTVTIGTGSTLLITSGGILVNSGVGANSSTITGGSILGSTTAPLGELMIHQNNTAGLLTINSNIVNSSGITKSGLGTLVLGGDNTFLTGSRLTINEGTVQLNGGGAIGDSTIVMMRTGTTLDLNNSNETIGNLSVDATNTSSGTIDLGSGTLTVNQTTTATWNGTIIGTGGLVKNGTGTLTIGGNNTFNGPVVINGGILDLQGSGGLMTSVSTFTLNAAELTSNQNDTTERDRIGSGADIILNNTAGTNGLRHITNQGNTKTENIGDIRIGAGHNVVTAHGNATNAIAVLQADTLTRLNTASQTRGTVLVRGNALGASSGTRGTIAFDSGAQATVNGFEVGGGGAATTQNISIIPWMIGDLSQTGLGNTFVTNVDATVGLRPLASSEYTTNAAGFDALTAATPSTNNVRFDTGATLTGTATAINSLVIDAATGQTVTGPANAIEITSGAILAASSGTTITHALGGFSAITTGGSRDYTTYVTSTTGTLTISSPLTSAVPLVKSGAGTLSLTNTGNLFTDVYLNQGAILIDDLDKVNGTTNTLHFAGGTLRLAAGFTDDPSTKPWNITTGGGSLDVSLVTAGVTLVNGIDDTTVSSSDTLNIFTRSAGTGSIGQLTIQGASTFTGTVIVRNSGTSTITDANGIVLNGSTNAAINGNLEIGDLVNVNNNFDAVVALGASDQIVDTATITFRGASGENAYFKLLGFNETVAGIIDTTANGVIENREGDTVSASGTLTLNSSTDYSYNGFMRDASAGTVDANPLLLVKQGTGTQTLSGANIRHSGTTTISGGALTLTDVTNWQSAITNNATLNINQTTGSRNQTQVISGSGTVNKLGAGTIVIPTATVNTYSGVTDIQQGILSVSASNNLGDASANNDIKISNGATLQSTGTFSLGATRDISLAGVGGTIEVTGTNTLTTPGSLIGDVCSPLTKIGTGLLVLQNTIDTNGTTFTGATNVNAGILQVGTGGTAGSAGTGQSGSGTITVASAASLAGSGTVTGPVTFASGSTLLVGDVTTVNATAGNSTTNNRTLTFTPASGTNTFDAGSSIKMEITTSSNPTPDSTFGGNDIGSAGYLTFVQGFATNSGNHDRLIFNTSNPTVAAGAEFIVSPASFTAQLGQIFNLVDWFNAVGGYGFSIGTNYRTGAADGSATDDLDLPDIASSGFVWDVSQFQSYGVVVVVPEPSRLMLLFFGLLGLGFRRRR